MEHKGLVMTEAQPGQGENYAKESLFGFARDVIVHMQRASTVTFVDKSTMILRKMMHV